MFNIFIAHLRFHKFNSKYIESIKTCIAQLRYCACGKKLNLQKSDLSTADNEWTQQNVRIREVSQGRGSIVVKFP